ncbi:MAG TPA: NTP transferase domain-containing protein [Candidatus Cloacimonadota bacterium]|nr:NTP transferase domain-containing protein [Candidatus Cloacimonadota bacterium]
MKPLAAIVLAAGKGTRMKSDRAKVTFPLADKPMIQRVVDTAMELNCSKISVIVGWKKDTVIACLEEDDRLEFIEQKEQLGTGHAVQMAESSFNEFHGDVFILCGDVPLLSANTLRSMYQEHQSCGAACTVLTAVLPDAGKYGRMLRDAQGALCGIVEYKDASEEQRKIQEFNTGIYCFDSRELFTALSLISNQNEQKEYYLTDTVSILYQQGKKVAHVILDDLMEVSGVNSQQQLAELEDIYLDKIRIKWLNSGVLMHNPATIHIGDDVIIEPDVEIHQGTTIKGKTTLETACVIGPNCYIEHAKICNDSILQGFNVIVNAYIKEHEVLEYAQHVIDDEDYE